MTPQTATPPTDALLERRIVEGLVNLPDEFARALELPVDSFCEPENRRVFEACQSLVSKNTSIDQLTVARELSLPSDRALVGTFGYPAIDSLDGWIQLLLNLRAARRVMLASRKVAELGANSGSAPTAYLDSASRAFAEAMTSRPVGTKHETMAGAMSEMLTQIDARRSNAPLKTLSTGFHGLNRALEGLEPGRLYIVAGRTGMGKSSLANQMALNVAASQARVLAINLEMLPVEVGRRFVASKLGINSRAIKSGAVSDLQVNQIATVANNIAALPLEYPNLGDITIEDLRRLARARMSMNLRAVFVDYLQLVKSSEERGSREQTVAAVSRGLKQMAKELEIPVVAVAQLNRDVEKRGGQRPGLADLRESGAIENDADVVMLLFREDYYTNEPKKPGICEVIIAKNRDGETGVVDMVFEKEFVRFKDAEVRHG